jgi:glycosyltransferase involved in cell wall biosynthesis
MGDMAGVISVIGPTLNAARQLPRTLAPLVDGVAEGLIREVIVADGGSRDETLEIADAAGCTLISGEANRSRLFRLGAARAKGKWLLFLHQGAALAPGWTDEAQNFFTMPDARRRAAAFRLAFDDPSRKAALFWARLRTQLTKAPRGNQGLLISRFLYDAIGGYQDLEEFEDADLIRRIGAHRLVVLEADIVISAAMYARHDSAWRSLRMILRRLMGADPVDLAKAQRAAVRVSSGV